MNILKRLKNIWAWGGIEIPEKNKELELLNLNIKTTYTGEEKLTQLYPKTDLMAQIIHMKPKDEVDEALESINPEKNG